MLAPGTRWVVSAAGRCRGHDVATRHEAEVAALYHLLAELAVMPQEKPSEYGRELLAYVQNWMVQGNKCGYPPCCVQQFVVDGLVAKTGNGSHRERLNHPGVDGYVLCDRCVARQQRGEGRAKPLSRQPCQPTCKRRVSIAVPGSNWNCR